MAAIPYQDDFPSLKDYFGGNGGNFAKFGESWDEAVDNADFWNEASAESRQNLMNFFLADYNNRFNVYQNELAYNRQKEMIAAENEYNSPKNQMARYMEGGLNPNVIYGQIQPGQQTQVAQYEPARATEVKAVGDPRGTKEQKLEQAMTVLGMVGSMVKQITGMAQDVEGVKSATLQNELLAAQLPFEMWKAKTAFSGVTDPYATVGVYDADGNIIGTVPSLNDWRFDVLFPRYSATRLAGSRAEWQDWYNTNISEPFKKIMTGRGNLLESQAGKSEYDLNMLNSVPEEVRGLVYFLLQIVKGFR